MGLLQDKPSRQFAGPIRLNWQLFLILYIEVHLEYLRRHLLELNTRRQETILSLVIAILLLPTTALAKLSLTFT